MKLSKFFKILVLVFVLGISSNAIAQCVSITDATTYTQNFDSLANTGTSSTVPAGWAFVEALTAADGLYAASTGGSNTGNTYSFGSAGSTERAFGGQLSGSLVPLIGACFTNNIGFAIATISVGYTGEQWRKNANATQDSTTVEYSLNATSINDALATWIAIPALTFTGPIADAGAGVALDGNLAANRVVIAPVSVTASVPVASSFYVRFVDTNISGTDHGMAIDDFSLSANIITAAEVSIGGRVTTFEGNAISRARVSLVDGNGAIRYAVTNPFGYYRFEDVAGGGTYLLSVRSKQYEFAEPTQVISASGDVSDVNFVALPALQDFYSPKMIFGKIE